MKLRLLMSTIGAVLLISAALAGCGGSKENTTTPKGVISGNVSYTGKISPARPVVVCAFKAGEQEPAYHTILNQPGPYTIENVDDSAYTILAFIDTGDKDSAYQPIEPSGHYDPSGGSGNTTIVVKDGATLKGIDVTVVDPK